MIYFMAWRASHGIMEWPGGPSIGYCVTLRASHGRVWPGGHRIVLPGGHRMVYGYDLAGKVWGLA